MEHRGSGFKKIKADYRRAVNYRSEVKPLFKSTPTSFFVTLYNLNYNVPIEKVLIDSENVAIDGKNVAIELAIKKLNASQNTISKATAVFAKMGIDGILGRSPGIPSICYTDGDIGEVQKTENPKAKPTEQGMSLSIS